MIELLKPVCGATHVDPQTEILLSFEGIPDDWSKHVQVTIDNQTAIEDGVVREPFETTRCDNSDKTGRWGLRSRHPLPPRDIFVHAECGDLVSQNQRFFVEGARATCPQSKAPQRARAKDWHPRGWFWIDNDTWHLPWGTRSIDAYPSRSYVHAGREFMAVYPKAGVCQMLDAEHTFSPMDEQAKLACAYRDQGWRVVGADDDGVHIHGDDHESHWDIYPDDIAIAGDMIHAKLGNLTFHLPLFYEPAMSEDALESWYMSTQPLDTYQMDCRRNLFVVWNDDRMVVRHNFDPKIGMSRDMLWTSDDIDAQFKDVHIINSDHMLVNNHIFLNTRHPAIYAA